MAMKTDVILPSVTSNQRVAEREAKVLEEHQEDRSRRDATRAAAWSSNERATRLQMDMNKVSSAGPKGKSSLADRAKYQFEAVSCTLKCDKVQSNSTTGL